MDELLFTALCELLLGIGIIVLKALNQSVMSFSMTIICSIFNFALSAISFYRYYKRRK